MTLFTRVFNKWQIDYQKGVAVKFSDNQKMLDEIEYYLEIQKTPFSIYFPRVIDYELRSVRPPFHGSKLVFEWYNYDDLGNFYIKNIHERLHLYTDRKDIYQWTEIFTSLRSILKEFENSGYMSPSLKGSKKFCEDMYLGKTQYYYDEFKRTQDSELFDSSTVTLNGVTYQHLDTLWDSIVDYVKLQLLDNSERYWGIIHGDFCFSNILRGTSGTLRFIDPRGSFGAVGIYGDRRYDIAKLWHSVDGLYDLLNHGEFTLQRDGKNGWNLQYPIIPPNVDFIRDEFCKIFFRDVAYEIQISMITGLIFVGAAARHYENRDRQIALYLTGIKLLNEGLDKFKQM